MVVALGLLPPLLVSRRGEKAVQNSDNVVLDIARMVGGV